MEVARLLAAHAQSGGFGDEPRRSVLFIAFGAEELGLIGSEHYCAQPRFPLTSVAAMLNFDMVGRLRDGALGVGGRSTASEWPELLTQQNTEHLLLQENDCAGCTDHVCFRRNNRPVLWFFTGFHDQYHQPADDTERINPAGLAQIANFAARITADLMLRDRAPIFRASN
jgi:Zn-dependent M28 family amino/carboxypeptidase